MDPDLKLSLCKAFCDDISVRDVPAGLAVSTGFDGPRGDPIGFYIFGSDEQGHFRIQDDGRTLPFLEAMGADLGSATRKQTFFDLMSEYDAQYDDNTFEVRTSFVPASNLPAAAMRFVALMLRLQDVLFLTQDRVASTFREDVVARLQEALEGRAEILEDAAVAPELGDYEADIVLRAKGHDPVAIFLASYDTKLQDAIILRLIARHEARIPCKVVALLEATGTAISSKMRQRADNRLDAVPVFRGDEQAAIAKLQRLATDEAPAFH